MSTTLKRTRVTPLTYEGTMAGYRVKVTYHKSSNYRGRWWDITLDDQWVNQTNTRKAALNYLTTRLAGVQR